MVGQSLSFVCVFVISYVAISSNLVVLESEIRNEKFDGDHAASASGKESRKFESSKVLRKRNTFDEYGNFDPHYKARTKESEVWIQFTSASPYLQQKSTFDATSKGSTPQVQVQGGNHEQHNNAHLIYQTIKNSATQLFENLNNFSVTINYIGCFATWEKQKTELLIPDYSHKYDESQFALSCAKKCQGSQVQISFVKGADCRCSPINGFDSEATDDSYCNIRCPVKDLNHITSTNADVGHPCGGNLGYSVYCISGQENCNDLLQEYERKRHAKEIKKNSLKSENSHSTKMIAVLEQSCAKCNYSENPFCKRPYIHPEYDYFPRNSPEKCVEYCGSTVTYVKRGPGDTERKPTKYALLMWWYDEHFDLPICSCFDEADRQIFTTVEDPSECNEPCPGNIDSICGGKERNNVIFATIYCVDSTDCTTLQIPPSTTTDDPCSDEEKGCDEDILPDTDMTTTSEERTTIYPTTEEPSTVTTDPDSSTITTDPSTVTTDPDSSTITTDPSTVTTVPNTTQTQPWPTNATESTTESQTTAEATSTSLTTTHVTTTTSTEIPSVSTSTPKTTARPTTEVISTTVALCDKKCQKTDRRGYYWEVCAGWEAIARCRDLHPDSNATGLAFWRCSEDGEFETAHPNVTNCASAWLGEKQEEIKNIKDIEDADAFVRKLSDACRSAGNPNSPNKYYGHEIRDITSMVELTVTKARNFSANESSFPQLESVVEKAVDLNAFLFQFQDPWKDLPLPEKSKISSGIIDNTEEALFHLMHETYNEHYKRFFATTNSSDANKFLILAETFDKESYSSSDGRYEFPLKSERDKEDSFIKLPVGWKKQVENRQIEIAAMSIDSEYISSLMPGQYDTLMSSATVGDDDDDAGKSKLINGNLISFTLVSAVASHQHTKGNPLLFNRPSMSFKGKGVEITFHHDIEAWGDDIQNVRRNLHDGEKPKAVLGSSNCVFWDTKNYAWSSEGCKTINANRYETTCECDHLTAFAILMDVHRYVGKEFGLEVLTLILCPASEIALLISILILSSVSGLQKIRATITKNLSICLFVGNGLVLLVLDRSYFNMNEEMCMGAAMVTHYAFLCAFMWMLIEGVQLYRMVVHVFDSGRSYIKYFGIFAYGSPIIIIAITATIGHLKGDKPYGGDVYCWLEGSYIWSFMGPVAVVTMINLVVLFIALKTAYHVQQNKKNSPVFILGKIQSYKTWFKGTFSLTIILGLTWIVGFFTLMKAPGGIVAAYIFTILNASQGLFIFFFNCVFNEKVRSFAQRNISTYLPSWLSSSITSNPGGNDGSVNGKRNLSSIKSGDSYVNEKGKKRTSTKRQKAYPIDVENGLPSIPPVKNRTDKEIAPVSVTTRRGPRNTKVDFMETKNTYISDIPMKRRESIGTISSVDSTQNSFASDVGHISSDNSHSVLISGARF